jgi:TfoX/Sxy family transcriptional regulator of competence genes
MEQHLIRTILTSMASIGKVEYRIKDGFTGFYRGKALFAKVQQKELYFLNDNGSFVKFEQPIDRLNIRFNLATAYNIAV